MANALKDRLFVTIQIILFFVFFLNVTIWSFEPSGLIQLLCIVFGIFGIIVISSAIIKLRQHISPFPTPSKNAYLITTGIFKHFRHPIYSGIILILFSTGLYLGSVYKILIALLVFVILYLKAIYEEKLLFTRFSEYHIYKKKTSRFLPRF